MQTSVQIDKTGDAPKIETPAIKSQRRKVLETKKQQLQETRDKKTKEAAQPKLTQSSDALIVNPRALEKNDALDLTMIVSSGMDDGISSKNNPEYLKTILKDLTPNAQSLFEDALEKRSLVVGAFHTKYTNSNSKYLAAKDNIPTNESIRNQFISTRETEKAEHIRRSESYEKKLKVVFLDRIKVLQQAIDQHSLESALLKQSIKGNNSYYNSFSVWNRELGYRYGGDFRLGEAEEALKQRKTAIGIKDDESAIQDAITIIKPSEFCLKFVKLSQDIVVLKEEVTICNETLRKDIPQIAANSDLPRNYYIYHKQRLDALKESITTIKDEFANHIEGLDKDIALQASTPDSPESIAYIQERLELNKRLAMIVHRQGEIDDLLALRKKQFNLDEKGLDTKDTVELPNLSDEYNSALNLIQRITIEKEHLELSNEWEKIAPMKQRQFTYFQESKKVEELAQAKKDFESETLPKREKVIKDAIGTYKTYIANIQMSMTAIETHFKQLAQESLQRAQWQLTPKVESLSTSQGSGFFGSWGWGSSIAKSDPEKKVEDGKQENAKAASSATAGVDKKEDDKKEDDKKDPEEVKQQIQPTDPQ